MNDDSLDTLFRQARSAQERVDLSTRAGFGFETRLAARLTAGRSVSPVMVIWRMVGCCSALTGMLAVWFLLTQVAGETEDDLTAFWDAGESAWNLELTN